MTPIDSDPIVAPPVAVDGLSFVVQPEMVTSFLGPNGLD
jgi:ABC-type multidrug transport system ATPase subunit